MKHPTVKQVQTLIDYLKKIEDVANKPHAFDIMENRVQINHHTCGTVHCVAGWFCVAIKNDDPIIKKRIEGNFCTFSDGYRAMSEILGFRDVYRLETWAEDNPDIWGNEYGDNMFYHLFAYNGLQNYTKNPMTIIIKHWEDVRDRIQEYERLQKSI